jgi:L-amino acid N-acyltransferase YncA
MPARMAFRIRSATSGDFAAIAAITSHYIETSAIHFAYQPVTATELEAMWHAGRARYPWLVAADDEAVIGYAKAGEWRSRDAYRWTAEVGLYVEPRRHRGGVGRALYQALLDACGAAGFRSVIGGVTLPNDPSVALHAAFGFEPVGVVRDAGFKRGAWHDVAFFQKRLRTDDAGPAA